MVERPLVCGHATKERQEIFGAVRDREFRDFLLAL